MEAEAPTLGPTAGMGPSRRLLRDVLAGTAAAGERAGPGRRPTCVRASTSSTSPAAPAWSRCPRRPRSVPTVGCWRPTSSPKMVDDTGRRARQAGWPTSTVRRCDAEQLDVAGPFDVALCSLGLMYVPSPAAAMREMRRVLRPGGVAVVSVWGERRNCGWAELFPIVDARVSCDVCPMFFALGHRRRLADLVARAGFVDVERAPARASSWSTPTTTTRSARRSSAGRSRSPTPGSTTPRSAGARRVPRLDRPYADGAGYRVPGEFVIASGRRP